MKGSGVDLGFFSVQCIKNDILWEMEFQKGFISDYMNINNLILLLLLLVFIFGVIYFK